MAARDTPTIRSASASPAGVSPTTAGRIVVFLMTLLAALPAHGQSLDAFGDDDPAAPWHIVADEVSYDQPSQRYTAIGKAEIFKKDRRLSAERITFDEKNMTASAEGRVMLTFKEDVLTADRVEIDLRSELGTLYGGTLFLKENNFIIRGERISKIGRQEYEVLKGSFSTCDGEVPDWKITARRLNVTIEGYGRASHAALWAREMPLVYSPYIVFPAKRKRQTGLLAPDFAFSDRKGTEFMQPFFWAAGDSQDATLFTHYMSERGTKLGGEYRYVLDGESRGTLMLDYLDDRKVDDGTGSSSEDYGFGGDEALRTNRDRYWLRGKIDQELPLELDGALDIDWVSDQDYLREFRHGPSGYFSSYKAFLDDYGREVDQNDDAVRTSRLNLNRRGRQYSFNGGALWRDDAILRQASAPDPTVQRLPFLQFDATRQAVFGSPLFFALGSEYAYLYRQDGTRGNRAILAPRLMWPLRLKRFLYVEPSAGVSETVYHVSRFDAPDGSAAGGDRSSSREAYDLRLDLFSEAKRAYAADLFGVDRIQHRLRPQVVYEYLPDIDQDDLPEFDAADRLEPVNRVTYALVNAFTYRRQRSPEPGQGADGPPDGDESPGGGFAYRQFGRFKVQQSYDIREERADDPSDFADGSERRPFSPVQAELDLFPGRTVSLSADTAWSPYDSRFVAHNLGAAVEDDRGDRLALDYHYRKGAWTLSEGDTRMQDALASETLSASGLLNLTGALALDAAFSRDIETADTTSTVFGVLFRRQCWSIRAGYEEEDDDRRFGFTILLNGLGEYGLDSSM